MRSTKEQAIALRRSGKSYTQICRALAIPKSTLGTWLKGVVWSQTIRERLSTTAREEARKRMTIISHRARAQRQKFYSEKRLYAQKIFGEFWKEQLFSSGLMIYWGEGDHSINNGIIRVSNTDPCMLRLFTIFLQKYFPMIYPKIRAYLVLYPDLPDERSRKYWSKNIGIPVERFIKSQYIAGRHPTKRLPYGVCTVMIQSKSEKQVMHEWLTLLRKEVESMRVSYSGSYTSLPTR